MFRVDGAEPRVRPGRDGNAGTDLLGSLLDMLTSHLSTEPSESVSCASSPHDSIRLLPNIQSGMDEYKTSRSNSDRVTAADSEEGSQFTTGSDSDSLENEVEGFYLPSSLD